MTSGHDLNSEPPEESGVLTTAIFICYENLLGRGGLVLRVRPDSLFSC
jgi:hypothetical protein